MRINLLPQPESSRQYRTMVLTGTAGVLALVNLWAAVAWIAASADRGVADAIYNRMSARLPQLQQQAAELGRREDLTRQIEAFNRWAADRPIFRDQVHLLSSLLPKDSVLLMVHFLGQADYDVKASFPDLESVATYLRQLQKSPKVASLKVKNVTRRTVTLSSGGPTGSALPLSVHIPQSIQEPTSGRATLLRPSPSSSGGTGRPSGTLGTVPVKSPMEDLLHAKDSSVGGPGGGGTGAGSGRQGEANTFSAARRAEPTGDAAGGAAPSLWNRLFAFLPWGTREARASDGPMPTEENSSPGGTSPAETGTATPPLSGSPSQSGATPVFPGTASQGGSGSAPLAKTVYELDFSVTLGR
ncbi:MAG: hypothetical protein QJR01_05075 [Kyrpidia sp.]|nr:hypothetical protein [Kyrpidia sp.]